MPEIAQITTTDSLQLGRITNLGPKVAWLAVFLLPERWIDLTRYTQQFSHLEEGDKELMDSSLALQGLTSFLDTHNTGRADGQSVTD